MHSPDGNENKIAGLRGTTIEHVGVRYKGFVRKLLQYLNIPSLVEYCHENLLYALLHSASKHLNSL